MSSFLSVAPTLLVLGIVIAVTLVTIWHVSVMRIEKFVDEMENMTERGCDSKRVQFFSNMEVRRRVNERLNGRLLPNQRNMLKAYYNGLLDELLLIDKNQSISKF